MINVSEKFMSKMKFIMKEKRLSYNDYVICIHLVDSYSRDSKRCSLYVSFAHMDEFKEGNMSSLDLMLKKSGCFISTDGGAFFILINKQISISKDGANIELFKAPSKGKKSMCGFIGKCLLEYIKNEKLTRKELIRRLNLTSYKFDEIIAGNYGNLNVHDLVNISSEFRGLNNVLEKIVLFEKCVVS